MENDEYWSSSDIKSRTIFGNDSDEETDLEFMGTTRGEVAQLSRTMKSDVKIAFKKFDDTIINDAGGNQSARFRPSTLPSVEKVVDPVARSASATPTQSISHQANVTPQRMVWKIILGQPYSLDQYKSKQQKLALLDCAIESHDGNAIIAVVLHIRSTLKTLLFNQILREKPEALHHYLAFLKSENEMSELTDTLSMVGRTEEAAILNYKMSLRSNYLKTKIMEMRKCYTNHFAGDPGLEFNSSLVQEHISLLERQAPIDADDEKTQKQGNNEIFKSHPKSSSLINSSVITTLYYCCLYHYGLKENNLASPSDIRKVYRLSDKQFIWTAVAARAKLQRWTDIETIMSTKTIFGASKIKFQFSPELFIELLKVNRASREILSKYINYIDDSELKLKLAKKCECHTLVVELLVASKDRVQLELYKSKLLSHSIEHQNAQDALNSSTIRWKN